MGRIDGKLEQIGVEVLTPEAMLAMARTLLTPEQWQEFSALNELDLAYTVPDLGRFRGNVFRQRGTVGIVLRRVLGTPPTFDLLGLPTGARLHLGAPRWWR